MNIKPIKIEPSWEVTVEKIEDGYVVKKLTLLYSSDPDDMTYRRETIYCRDFVELCYTLSDEFAENDVLIKTHKEEEE